MNPNMLMQMLKAGGNPQAMLQQIISQQAPNNPIMANVWSMMQKGDAKGVEQVARNLCKSKGVDADQMLNNIKRQFFN